MKFLELVVLMSLLVVLTGCPGGGSSGGSGSGGSTNPTPTPTPTPAPTISSSAPAGGPLAGGTLVTVNGANYFTGALIKINGVSCSPTTLVNSGQVTCTTPAAGAGTYNVTVTTGSGTSGASPQTFQYTAAPVISNTGLSLLYGPIGSTITVTGNTFSAAGLVVKVNGIACTTSNFISATQVSCVVPGGLTNMTAYTMTVTTTAAGTSAASIQSFTVRAVPGSASSIYYSSNVSNEYCGILSDSSVDCWGANPNIQNSNGATIYIPQLITEGPAMANPGAPLVASKIAVGQNYACAVVVGGVACWGYVKPDGSPDGVTTLIPNASFSGGTVTDVAVGGDFACVLLSTGNAQCWGDGIYFGDNYAVGTSTTPITVKNAPNTGPLLTATTGITAGLTYACAVGNTGTMWCWGTFNSTNNYLPVSNATDTLPSGNGAYANLSTSSWFTCASDPTNGSADYLYCWGNLDQGFSGGNQSFAFYNPNNYYSAAAVSQVATSQQNVCILINPGAAGTEYCWGDNTNGQFGDGTVTGSSYTTPNFSTAVSLAAIQQIAGLCAVVHGTGAVDCWGPGPGLGVAAPPAYVSTPQAVGAWQ